MWWLVMHWPVLLFGWCVCFVLLRLPFLGLFGGLWYVAGLCKGWW